MWKKYEYWLVGVLCCLVAIGVHSLAIDGPPQFDDRLLLAPGQIFTRYINPLTSGIRWLSYGTFAWTYQLVGANWSVFHIQNAVLHAGVVAMLYVFYAELNRRLGLGLRQSRYLAAGGALLFAVHPIGIYAVSYLVQRSLVMATLFALFALYAMLRATEVNKKGWLVAAGLAYLLALSSKEHAIMLPLVAGAALYLVSISTQNARLKKNTSYVLAAFILAAGGVAAIYGAQVGVAFDQTSKHLIEQLASQYPDMGKYPYLLSVINESYLFFKYLALWVCPLPSWISVDMRQAIPVHLLSWPQMLGPIAYILYGLLGLGLLRKGGVIGLLGFGLLVPWLLYPTEFAAIWIQDPFVVYRSYFWLIGLPAFLPILQIKLGNKPTMAIVVALTLGFSAASIIKQQTFKTELALWDDAVRYNARTDDPLVLGKERALNERALQNIKAGHSDEALADYKKAIEINPRDPSLYANLGALYVLMSRFDLANAAFEKALSIDPKHPRARYNKAAMLAQNNQIADAMRELNDILKDPQTASQDAYEARGVLLLKSGVPVQAEQDLTNAIRLGARTDSIFMNRAVAKAMAGDMNGAIDDLDKAINLNPDAREAYINRALALLKVGRAKDALADADKAVSLGAEQSRPHLVRAQIYVALGRVDEALAEYDRLIEGNPNESMARLNRGEVYLALGRVQGARADLEVACRLGLKQGCARLAAVPR